MYAVSPLSLTNGGTYLHGNKDSGVINVDETLSSPTVLSGPLAWQGADYQGRKDHVLQLTRENLDEINNALSAFHELRIDGDLVNRDNFPLPTLGHELDACAEAIHNGRGFCIIRGLDAVPYTLADSVLVFLGISSYIGEKRGMQDREGHMLSHITSSKQWSLPLDFRHGIHSNRELPLHNDMGCDVLSLQARHSARDGGHTYLSSAYTVYNDLMQRDPGVIETLLAPNWPVRSSSRDPPFYLAPLFALHDGRLMSSLDPDRIGPHPNMPNPRVPQLTPRQGHALRALFESARRVELQIMLLTGDMLYFNNLSLFHRRDAYEDGDSSSRHLVRLWLRNQTLGWSIPPLMRAEWNKAYENSRNLTDLKYPIDPSPEYKQPKYTIGSAGYIVEEDDDGF